MTFEGFETALPIESGTMPIGPIAVTEAGAGMLEQVLRASGLGDGLTDGDTILDRRDARASLTVLDLWGGGQRTAFDLRIGGVAGPATAPTPRS